jgi:hypothetical protein
MNKQRFYALLFSVVFLLTTVSNLAAQFNNGIVLSSGQGEVELTGRCWHLSSKLDDNPLLGAFNGYIGTVGNNLSETSTFVLEEGADDGKWWTADVRWFLIRSVNTGLYVTLNSDSPSGPVSMEPLASGDDLHRQQFRIIFTATAGWYKFRSRVSSSGDDLVLEIGSDNRLYARAPQLDPSADQKFAFNLALPYQSVINYTLVDNYGNDFMSNALDNVGANPVHINYADQSIIWHFIDHGEGYFSILNTLTNLYVAVGSGTKLVMSATINDASKWEMIRAHNSFKFKNKDNGKFLGTFGITQSGESLRAAIEGTGNDVKWTLYRVMQGEESVAGGNYQRISDAPAPTGCVFLGNEFKKAVLERVGLPADLTYFPFLQEAIAVALGPDMVTVTLEKFDLNNPGHRVDLAIMVKDYVLNTLAAQPRSNWTALQAQAVSHFEQRVESIRADYAQRLLTSWDEFNTQNPGASFSFSALLDHVDVADYVWPDVYVGTSAQLDMMNDYASAGVTFNAIQTDYLPGSASATLGLCVLFQFHSIPATLAFNASSAAASTAASTVGMTGGPVTILISAAMVLASEVIEVQAILDLMDDIQNVACWANAPVHLDEIMQGHDLVAKLKVAADMDYFLGAPVQDGFQYNTNDNQTFAPFLLSCQNNLELVLDDYGNAALTPEQIGSTSVFCGGDATISLNTTSFNCSNIGANQVTLTASNSLLNTSCNSTIMVVDRTGPRLNCKSATVALNASGEASITPSSVYQNGLENCGNVGQQTVSPNQFTCADFGQQLVTLTAQDAHGNTGTCQATVSIIDQMAPSVICKDATVFLDNAGSASLQPTNVFQSGADNCGAVNLQTVLPNAFNCSNLGSNSVTLTVNDGHGNTKTCTATVSVVDAVKPSVTCKNFAVNLSASGNAGIITSNVFQGGSDNCGAVNQQSVSPSTFNCSNLGLNTVTLTVNDGHGNTNTCNSTVTVSDPIIPTALCKNATLYLNASGQATLSVAQVNNGSFDNCTIVLYSLSQSNFTCANLGANTVALAGIDASNNKGTCNATVTVLDAIAPTAKCKNGTVNLGANGTISVVPSAVDNVSADNCSFSLSLTPNSFTCSQIGSNTVTLKATDVSGNTHTCTATVTVKDVSAPVALCKNATVTLNNAGQGTLLASQLDNGITDNCGLSSMTLSKTQFSCSDLPGSSQTVTLTLKDASNNTSSCQAQVTTKDFITPTAFCENTTVQLGANGTVIVYGSQLAGDSYDNCSVWSYSPTAKVYTTANMGNNNLTITVKDWSGNGSTCVSVVTVTPYTGNSNFQQSGGSVEQETIGASSELLVYPNPTSGNTTLAFQLSAGQPFSCRIFDLSGRMVYNQEGIGVDGENSLPLTMEGLAPGIYLVDFQSNNWKVQRKLVLQR